MMSPTLHGTTDDAEWVEIEFDGFPWRKPEHFWKHSPLAYVDDIHTPLLILHSDNDFRAPVSEAEQLFTALRRLQAARAVRSLSARRARAFSQRRTQASH